MAWRCRICAATRALTGSQHSGDRFAEATLESLRVDLSIFDGAEDVKLPLFRAFHLVWACAGAPHLIDTALRQMQDAVAGRILVIEDEAIIAMDISANVEDMGHQVTGVGSTRTEAVALADRARPDLILADIQRADTSSGIDAVTDILARFAETPVIFITAFPERFLTGKKPEPGFLIAKPHAEDQTGSAVSQAMFFASPQTLSA